jgi:hypothetical protein
MLKRVALLGSIAALTVGSAGSASAQDWGGGWGGGGWGGGGWGGGAVTVTVSGFPGPIFPRREVGCCFRPSFPRTAWCCHRSFFPHRFYRPPYFYGDNFAPYAYNFAPYAYDYGSYYGAGYGGDGGY